ncbi:MAG TPA: hypothetical protein VLA75_10590 [Thermoanaerobaculia bacterium]|nr:hypothetical protein [Thermoanaerobaculia bacterium]
METPELELLASLLRDERVLSLGVLVEGAPLVGVLPFLAAPDLGSMVVHSTRLARHSRGLVPGAPCSGAIHRPDCTADDPLRLPRLLFEGRVEEVGEEEAAALAPLWVARFASAAMTVQLGDFGFHRLRIESGRLVAGFGRAFGVGPAVLAEAAALGR